MQKKYYSKFTASKETKKSGSSASSVARNTKSSYDDKPDDIGEIPWLIAKSATEGWSNEKFQTEFKRAQSNINVPRTRQQTDPARDNLASWLSPDKYSELETKARNTYIPAQFGQRMLDNERMREYAERYQNTYIPATLAQDAIHRSGTGNDFNALADNALRSEFLRKLDTKSMQDELDALNNDLDSNKQQYNRTKAQYASYGNNTSDNGARAAKRYIDEYESKQKRAAELERDIYDADNLQTLSKYSKYSENDDFSEYAKRGAEIENPTWFQSEKGGLIPNLFNGGGSKINNPVTFYLENQHKGGEEAYEFMSDDELDTYNYVLAKYGSDEAEKYLSALRPQLNARSTGKLTADAAALANDYPVLSSAGSVLMTPLRTLGYIDASIKDASGQRIDPNSRNWLYGNMQNAARETVSENIASGATGNVGAFLYNTGMSVADNAAMVLMTGGGSIGQTVNLGIMGLGAASSSTQEALSRGATQDQALQVGVLAGIAEALFEKVSLDNFIKMTSPGMRGAFLKNVLKQGGIEASEEICTEIANIISDELVMGGMSKYNTAVSEYIARGLTREEAERRAMADQAKEIGLSGLGGFLSGGAFGSFGQAIGNARASSLYKDGSYNSDALINAALSMQDGSASKQLALEIQSGKVKSSNANLGHLLANYLNEGGDITSIIPSEQNTAEAQSAEEILRNGARAVAERETARMNANAAENVVQQNTAQIQPVTLDNANSVSNTNDTRKTAETSVATSDMATQRTVEHRSASEAASSLRSAIERSTDSVNGLDVYSDEDGSVTVSRNGSVLAEMDAREASAMASSYDSETNAIDYIGGFHAAYQLASEGMTINQITDTSILASDLTRAQLQAAYDSGRNASIESKRAAALDPKATGFKAGVNRIDQSTNLSRKQRSQIRILDAIGKKYGVEIIVDNGVHYSDNGTMMSRSDANGFYNPSTGRIHINLNAVGEAYLAVGMHELVHHVKNFNESGYNTLESVVLGALEERGENVDALVKYQMEHFGYSESQAREEIVANSIPAILNDEAYVRKLVETDRTLAERIRDFLSDFVEFINETLRALEGEASWKQMRSLREDMDTLSTIAELFDVALLDAQSQHSKTPTHGERFSMKDPDMIDTREISPINDVTDRAKYEYLVEQFENEGYVGRPVVVVENGNDGYIALTGSHRILAASEANIDVPCVVIPYSDEIIPLIQAYSDEDRVREATALYEAGEIDEDAYNLIVREEELNFENYNVPYTDQLRFSLKDASTVDVAAVERENSKLMKSLALAEDQVKLTRGHRVKEGYIGVLADKALRDYSSSYDSATLKDNLIKIFKFLAKAQKPNMSEVNSLGVGLMKAVLEKSNEFDADGYNAYSDVRSYLRSTSITLSEDQRAEAAALSDTYGKYRSSLFGSVKLTNDGLQLDTAWQELSSMNSALFPPETNASDMPRVLAVAAEAIKRGNFYTNPYGYDLDTFAADAWSNLLESYFKSQTFADVKQSEIDALNQKMRDERNAARKDAKAAEREIIRNAEQHAKEIAKRDKREAELRDQILLERVKGRDRMKRYRENRNESEAVAKYRKRIERNAKDLTNWLIRPTDAKHVPEVLRKITYDFMQTIDFAGDSNSKVAIAWRERMRNLKDAMQRAERGTSEFNGFYADIDPDLVPRLEAFIDTNKSLSVVSDMNSEQLRELDYIVGILKHAITDVNKLHSNARNSSLSAIASSSVSEMETKRAKRISGKFGTMLDKFFNADQLDSFSFFDQLGDSAKSILTELRSGFDKKVVNIRTAIEFMDSITEDKATRAQIKNWTGSNAKAQTFKLSNGKEIALTIGQVMELYCLNKREQARGHIYGGGIKPAQINSNGTKSAARTSQTAPTQVTQADVDFILSSLTEQQRYIADKMQSFMNGTCADWGNEVSLTLYGYKKFTEANYYPIKSDENYTNTKEPEKANGFYTLKNLGMTKATVANANNPLVIGDIFDTFSSHVDDMATYNAFVVPLSDAMKWYNFRGKDGDTPYSVKQSIERVSGKSGQRYFMNLIRDINGTGSSSYKLDIADALTRNAKAAAVGANLRVVVQQPTAYIRAASEISPKYLAAAVFKRSGIKKAFQYCPIAQWKAWGYYDMSIGKSMKELITGTQTGTEKIKEASLWAAGKADEITWGTLWNACELEVAATKRGLNPGTEAFNQAVGARLSEIIDRTQVVDTVFHRSQIMRSKDGLVKMSTSFMSEPTKTYNMLYRAAAAYAQNKGIENGKQLIRVAATHVLTSIATAAVAALVDAFRDDDEEKDWTEKYVSNLADNMLDGLNPLNLIPIGKEVMSLIDGYDPSRLDTQGIEKIINVGRAWVRYAQGESGWSLYRMIYKSADALSSVTGVPVGNLLRAFNSIYNTVSDKNLLWDDSTRMKSKIKDALAANDADAMQKAINEYLEKANADYQKQYKKYMPDEKSKQKSEAWVKSIIKSMYASGELTREQAENALKQYAGVDDDASMYRVFDRWDFDNSKAYDDDTEYPGVYDRIFSAIMEGSSIDAHVSELESNGYEKESINTAIKQRIREWYQDKSDDGRGSIGQDQAVSMLTKYCDLSPDDAQKRVKQWACYVDTGINYDDIRNEFNAGNITASRAKEMLVQYGGLSTDDAQKRVSAYEFFKEYPEYYSEISEEAIGKYNEYCKGAGVNVKVFAEAYAFKNDTKADVDKNGDAISGSKRKKVLDYINKLGISNTQKDALYYAFGYAESTIKDAPWK